MTDPKTASADRPEVLTAARLWAPMMEALHGVFRVHDRLHETDPAAFAAVAPRIRAIAGSGESKIPRELIARLPALWNGRIRIRLNDRRSEGARGAGAAKSPAMIGL